ncbi:putative immunoglobulin-blocking virulence protein [Mycoplasma procyoni]|uniref:putative immunoglobulin-blocking virulence protein n=1 Tax=Mycoplasma procyoni TaxID=568784 RepID=UPI00197BD4C5|nr:putative immunoglobulin-blocking virulence protein [Mycoplasma procyoni]MBN3534791.1 putative immunoglobulin-blocking virulence protein [Mycoplasma procyoni]
MKITAQNKKILILSGWIIAIPLSAAAVSVFSLKDFSSIQNPFLASDNIVKIDNRDVNFHDGENSIRDHNLKPNKPVEPETKPIVEEITKPEIIEEKPEEITNIPVVDPNKEPEVIEYVENGAIEDKNPPIEITVPEPQPIDNTNNKPSSSLGQNQKEIYVYIGGVKTKVVVETRPPREQDSRDIAAGIVSPINYVRYETPEIVSVEVTEAAKEGNKKDAISALNKTTFPSHIAEEIRTNQYTDENLKRLANTDFYKNRIDKFRRLLENGDAVYPFLSEEGQRLYPELKKIQDKDLRFIKIIAYLDLSKFTKVSEAVNNDLAKGLTIGEDNSNVYINEKGEIDSYSRDVVVNAVQHSLIRDNSTLRVFGYDSYYGRTPGSIAEGTYPGWTKTDITDSQEFKHFNVSKSDGFSISRLDRIEPKENQRNSGVVVEIDAANPSGYAKIENFIKQAKTEGVEITSYRIKNMGSKDSNQRFYSILKALPDHLPQLELFFEGSNANTQALIALENKKINELSMYTSGNSLKKEWSINPLALRNTDWVNTIDYNVSFDYALGSKVPTRITFDTLAFEQSDLLSGPDRLKRINDGLRMAYFVRNNEAVFQGGFGSGLNPDQNEGWSSYPVGLDLSRVTSLKSLRGLIFKDQYKPANGERKLKRIVLFNNSDTFSIDTEELAEAQFTILDRSGFQMPKSEIRFSNEAGTQKIKLNGSQLSSSAIENLNILLEWNPDFPKHDTEILVDYSNTKLYNQLKTLGYKVRYESGDILV